jgi:hypothetical protein
MVLGGELDPGSTVTVDAQNGKLRFEAASGDASGKARTREGVTA